MLNYMPPKLFVDTWGWLTLHDQRETQHREAVQHYQSICSQNGWIYTTDYVLDETFTLLFKRLSNVQAKHSMMNLLKAFEVKPFSLIWITEERFVRSKMLRLKYLDKPQISFTDLTSMVVMQEMNITTVLTGDSHFLQVGMDFQITP